MSFSSAATPVGQLLLLAVEETPTIRLEDLYRESKWIVLLYRRNVDVKVLGRKSSSIIRLDLDFFAGVVGPKLS
jgi:hypothetical protein